MLRKTVKYIVVCGYHGPVYSGPPRNTINNKKYYSGVINTSTFNDGKTDTKYTRRIFEIVAINKLIPGILRNLYHLGVVAISPPCPPATRSANKEQDARNSSLYEVLDVLMCW